jgi:hypothetical protein
MSSWLETLLSMTDEAESPAQYWRWAALTAISAVVKNNVSLNRHIYRLYPNIYVILVGKSAIKKGPPIALARNLVTRVDNTRVIGGRASIQGIVKELASTYTTSKNRTITDNSGYIVSSEFASSLVEDPAATNILLDLYDGDYHKDGWKNTLKGSAQETLVNPSITLLSGSNETNLKDIIGAKERTNGFVGRIFFIPASRRHTINSLVYAPKVGLDSALLSEYLKELAQITGEFEWSEKGGSFYDDWYRTLAKQIDEDDSDETGTTNRLGDHVLKVAMLLHLARCKSLVLEKRDIDDAIEACQPFIKAAADITLGQGTKKDKISPATLLKDILSAKDYTLSRETWARKHWRDISINEFDSLVDTLKQTKAIEKIVIAGEVYWRMTDYAINIYANAQKRKGD